MPDFDNLCIKPYNHGQNAQPDSLDWEMPSANDFKNQVISITVRNTVMIRYFDNEGILHISNMARKNFYEQCSQNNEGPKITLQVSETETAYYQSKYNRYNRMNNSVNLPKSISGVSIHKNYLREVITSMESGNTIANMIERYNYRVDTDHDMFAIKYKKEKMSSTDRILYSNFISEEVRRFILRVESPKFERETGNENNKTFDFIRIFLSIPGKDSCPNRADFIKKHQQEIFQIALQKIGETKRFTKFGIPLNVLTLESAMITRQSQLQLLFGIKRV